MDISVLESNSNLEIKYGAKGSGLSTFGSGGICRTLVCPRSASQLIWCLTVASGAEIIGCGSNTLISDGGVDQTLIRTCGMKGVKTVNNIIEAEAGLTLRELQTAAEHAALSGVETLSGIPGTVGGAVYMNAGCYGRDIASLLEYADVFYNGRTERMYPQDMNFNYRYSRLMDSGGTVIRAAFRLSPSNYTDIAAERRRVECLRADSHPKAKSLGSVFKAHDGIPAAKLIETTGLKGVKVGGAELSRKHCNFIINTGGATSRDYISLARLVQDEVRRLTGVALIAEITYKGEADEDIRRLSHPYGLQPR